MESRLACFVAFDPSFVGKGHCQPQLHVDLLASRDRALHMRVIPMLVPTYPVHWMPKRPHLMFVPKNFDGALAHLVHT